MADLHRNGTSPNGKYGFSCTTFHGNTSLDHGWADTWEEYFTTRTKVLIEMEQKAQGVNEEILQLSVPFFEKVVPRLLRPLETMGNSIKPSLVHGDLWYGNTSTDADTDLPIIYDAACFYAHNEYDLGVWRASWNKLGKPYFNRYFKHFPIAAPEDDHDDRNLLYATRVNILDSILYKGYSGYREKLISDMRKLVEKFPGGYDGWAVEQEGMSDSNPALIFETPPSGSAGNERGNHNSKNPQKDAVGEGNQMEGDMSASGAATLCSNNPQSDNPADESPCRSEARSQNNSGLGHGQEELHDSLSNTDSCSTHNDTALAANTIPAVAVAQSRDAQQYSKPAIQPYSAPTLRPLPLQSAQKKSATSNEEGKEREEHLSTVATEDTREEKLRASNNDGICDVPGIERLEIDLESSPG